ncbi:MAG: DUF1499 domain-containing protein [Verrucomicrobiota bacterium]
MPGRTRLPRRTLLLAMAVLAALSWGRLLNARTRPVAAGLVAGRLAHCPDRPNCVASQDASPEQTLAPLACHRAPAETLSALAAWLRGQPRVTVIRQTPEYLHATFRSGIWGFVDDVEFLAEPGAGVIHVRSASRVGYSDLGANRRRVENLRQALERAGVLGR